MPSEKDYKEYENFIEYQYSRYCAFCGKDVILTKIIDFFRKRKKLCRLPNNWISHVECYEHYNRRIS